MDPSKLPSDVLDTNEAVVPRVASTHIQDRSPPAPLENTPQLSISKRLINRTPSAAAAMRIPRVKPQLLSRNIRQDRSFHDRNPDIRVPMPRRYALTQARLVVDASGSRPEDVLLGSDFPRNHTMAAPRMYTAVPLSGTRYSNSPRGILRVPGERDPPSSLGLLGQMMSPGRAAPCLEVLELISQRARERAASPPEFTLYRRFNVFGTRTVTNKQDTPWAPQTTRIFGPFLLVHRPTRFKNAGVRSQARRAAPICEDVLSVAAALWHGTLGFGGFMR
ncbi:hypothetical protein POSPLADRAFT_1034008 [Postia placenta MAD-698-R-SB12]|uniref:Uncharacterized protein n=1 Tax=Postia placenta MAD-698-R-SB12 TaxID=670580 RepID=A0A1X6N1C2_9APHY|nr:hypothetical protein POSPLADRAFT_1034008 [Postia placenta MAD-698-R-SB12]OSX62394.1 hypothetical protein POSPLADRAFT_1034008 [Postia placenta MAD-698-R-SB12]